jgi:LSD1 subclass zinc finger protein
MNTSIEGHALCSTCGQLLSFPVGSALVQCPICKTVVSLRPICKIVTVCLAIHSTIVDTMAIGGQTRCSGCHQNMIFPLGATVVQCTNCSSITHCPSLRYFFCRGCGLHLAYCASPDVTSVLCTVCNTLRDIVSIEMESFLMQLGHKRIVPEQEESLPSQSTRASSETTQGFLPSSSVASLHSNEEEDRETVQMSPVERTDEEEN